MEQQLKQCPKTGIYYYADIPEEVDAEAEEAAKAPVEAPKSKMGRPPKKQR